MRVPACFIAAVLAACNHPAVRAETPPLPPAVASTTEVRAAISRGLAFLEKEGIEWHEDKGCLSCHHTPFLVWTHQEARSRGFPVDPKKLDEWTGWCAEQATDAKGGNDVLAELLVYLARRTVPTARHSRLEAIPAKILSVQKPDGSWAASGQFHSEQWPAREADEVTTMLMLQALGPQWADSEKSRPALEKGLAWLQTHRTPTPQAVRTHAIRLLFAAHQGREPASLDSSRTALLAQQQPDGGWSWKAGAQGSDPITTGEVLHALGNHPSPDSSRALPRAVAWLLKTQRADGAWYQDHRRISSRVRPEEKPRIDGIYTYWSTAWATLGLLSSLPPVDG